MSLQGVILDDYQPPPSDVVYRTLVERAELQHGQARQMSEHCRGIVAAALPQEIAAQVAADLNEAGYPAQLWPTATLIRETKPRQVRYLELGPEAFAVERQPQGKTFYRWEHVRVLALAMLIEDTKEVTTECIETFQGRDYEIVHYTRFDRKRRVACDLAVDTPDGEGIHLRIVGSEFNYQRAIGANAGAGWLDNLTRLLAMFGVRSERAAFAPGYERFIENRDTELIDRELPTYLNEEEYLAYIRWLW